MLTRLLRYQSYPHDFRDDGEERPSPPKTLLKIIPKTEFSALIKTSFLVVEFLRQKLMRFLPDTFLVKYLCDFTNFLILQLFKNMIISRET